MFAEQTLLSWPKSDNALQMGR